MAYVHKDNIALDLGLVYNKIYKDKIWLLDFMNGVIDPRNSMELRMGNIRKSKFVDLLGWCSIDVTTPIHNYFATFTTYLCEYVTRISPMILLGERMIS